MFFMAICVLTIEVQEHTKVLTQSVISGSGAIHLHYPQHLFAKEKDAS